VQWRFLPLPCVSENGCFSGKKYFLSKQNSGIENHGKISGTHAPPSIKKPPPEENNVIGLSWVLSLNFAENRLFFKFLPIIY
jgi:hypothetical protein